MTSNSRTGLFPFKQLKTFQNISAWLEISIISFLVTTLWVGAELQQWKLLENSQFSCHDSDLDYDLSSSPETALLFCSLQKTYKNSHGNSPRRPRQAWQAVIERWPTAEHMTAVVISISGLLVTSELMPRYVGVMLFYSSSDGQSNGKLPKNNSSHLNLEQRLSFFIWMNIGVLFKGVQTLPIRLLEFVCQCLRQQWLLCGNKTKKQKWQWQGNSHQDVAGAVAAQSCWCMESTML